MSKYQIDITLNQKDNVKSRGLTHKRSMDDIKRQLANSKRFRLKKSGAPGVFKQVNTGRGLKKTDPAFSQVIKVNRDLIREIKNNTEAHKNSSKNDGVRKPGVGRGGTGGAGAGLNRFGGAIPILGTLVAAAGFTISQINKVGKSYLQRARAQAGSAGIGGFQRSGDLKSGYFDASQISEFVKSRRMASGHFNTGGHMGREGVGGAISYARLYGLSAGEIGDTLGTFEKAGSGKDLTSTIGQAQKAGMETEIPLFISTITDQLKEAVKNGVNASNIARDMGAQIAFFSRNSDAKSKEHIMSMIGGIADIQGQTAKGNYDSFDQRNMLTAARGEVKARLKSGDQNILKYIKESTDITPEELKKAQKTGVIGYITESKLATRLMEQKDAGVTARYLSNVMHRATGGVNNKNRTNNAWTFLNKHGSYLVDNTQNFDTLMKAFVSSGGNFQMFSKRAMTPGSDLNKVIAQMDKQSNNEGGSIAYSAGRTDFKREIMGLSDVAREAAKSVQVFEDALFHTAKTMEGGVMGTIKEIKKVFKKDNRNHKEKAGEAFKNGFNPISKYKYLYHKVNSLWEK